MYSITSLVTHNIIIMNSSLRPDKDGCGSSSHLQEVLKDGSTVDQHLVLDEQLTHSPEPNVVEESCQSWDEQGHDVGLCVRVLELFLLGHLSPGNGHGVQCLTEEGEDIWALSHHTPCPHHHSLEIQTPHNGLHQLVNLTKH